MENKLENKITEIKAEEILDSRGKSTLRVTVMAGDVAGNFDVPSGASTGATEAIELRDENGSVKPAIEMVNTEIRKALVGQNVLDQESLDRIMIDLDGTPNKSRLGGNAIVGASVAACKCAAALKGVEPYEHLRSLISFEKSDMTRLFINLINGGKHSKKGATFQEFQIIPETSDVERAYEIGIAVQNSLRDLISKKEVIEIGDEGGFVLHNIATEEFFEILQQAVDAANIPETVYLSCDVAASSFYKDGKYIVDGKEMTADMLLDFYDRLLEKFQIAAIEDPFDENDFESFAKLRIKHPDVVVIGDDLTTTNIDRLQKAIETKSINGIIIKLNQIGTVTESLEAMFLADQNGVKNVVSHRSGETMDDFIADLAFAFKTYGLKTGAPKQAVRDVKYKRLIEISKKG